ncbi:MAG: hypothetical protein ACYSWP_16995 [Planctomycetota bacterium]|jgi:hypothetical protein
MTIKVFNQPLLADQDMHCEVEYCGAPIKRNAEYYRAVVKSVAAGNQRLDICIECGDQLIAADKANEGNDNEY